MSEEQARALFIKYGCDAQGLLPYDVFAARLLSSPARLLALEPEQKVGNWMCVGGGRSQGVGGGGWRGRQDAHK